MRDPVDSEPYTLVSKRVALLAAAALALAACGGGSPNEAASTTVIAAASTAVPTTAAPTAPVVQAISGNQVDFGDALTQDTVLWFWAPW